MRIVRANVTTSTVLAPPFRRADAAALAVAPVAPKERQARSPAARRRDVRAGAFGQDRPGRTRHRPRPVAAAIRGRPPPPRRPAGADRAPSRRPPPDATGRRTPAPPEHERRPAAGPRTLRSAAQARQSGRRNARRAVPRYGGGPPCSRRTPAPRGRDREGSAGAGADRARHITLGQRE